jgi:hypothetical protein
MNADESERLWGLVRTLLRQPEPIDNVEARRALTVLTSSRADATYLLLQRALVLELALERVKAQLALAPAAVAPGSADGAAAAAPAPAADEPRPARAAGGSTAALPRPSPFVRDAATIAAGVVAGGLVLGGLEALSDDMPDGDGLGLADWL